MAWDTLAVSAWQLRCLSVAGGEVGVFCILCEILYLCEAGRWQGCETTGLLSCESCWDAWKEVTCSPVQLLAGLQVSMGPGDVPAVIAEDPPPGLKQHYPPTSFIV